MFFDTFDILEAHYLYCSLNHQGQGSRLYRRLSAIIGMGFNPRPNLRPATLTENGKAIYSNLYRRERSRT